MTITEEAPRECWCGTPLPLDSADCGAGRCRRETLRHAAFDAREQS